MLSDHYLEKGLTALSRAWTKNPMVGHTGAAVIAAYYFCKENDLGESAQAPFQKLVDILITENGQFWTGKTKDAQERVTLFTPYPDEPSNPTLLNNIVSALDNKISILRSSGHCTIFASLALKGLTQMPHLTTPSIIDGICKLIDKFGDSPGKGYYGNGQPLISGVPVEPEKHLEPYRDIQDVILTAFHEIVTHDHIKRQGYGGHVHLITHTNALLELHEMGYSELSQKGYHAHQTHIMLLRSLPPDDKSGDIAYFQPAEYSPLTHNYWNTYDHTTPSPSGLQHGGTDHVFKVSYAFFHILKTITDSKTRSTYLQQIGYVT